MGGIGLIACDFLGSLRFAWRDSRSQVFDMLTSRSNLWRHHGCHLPDFIGELPVLALGFTVMSLTFWKLVGQLHQKSKAGWLNF